MLQITRNQCFSYVLWIKIKYTALIFSDVFFNFRRQPELFDIDQRWNNLHL